MKMKEKPRDQMYGSKLLTAAVDNNNNKVQQSFGRPWMWFGEETMWLNLRRCVLNETTGLDFWCLLCQVTSSSFLHSDWSNLGEHKRERTQGRSFYTPSKGLWIHTSMNIFLCIGEVEEASGVVAVAGGCTLQPRAYQKSRREVWVHWTLGAASNSPDQAWPNHGPGATCGSLSF